MAPTDSHEGAISHTGSARLENLFIMLCFMWALAAIVVASTNEPISQPWSLFLAGMATGFGLAAAGVWGYK